ncbi:MAG: DNA translocase FtsK 4TM domain-containing protein [Candidatus Spechtbacterales bacterium]
MAKKKKRKHKNEEQHGPRLGIEPDVLKGVWSIALVALAAISTLSFMGKAGSLGGMLERLLNTAFGWGMYVAPLLLLVMAVAFLLSWGRHNDKSILLAAGLFFSGLLGFFALTGSDTAEKIAHGGQWGRLVLLPLQSALGLAGAIVVLTSIMVVAVLIGFNISVGRTIAEKIERRRLRDGALGVDAANAALAGVSDMPQFKVKTLGEETDLNESAGGGTEEAADKKNEAEVLAPSFAGAMGDFTLPPIDLLQKESGKPTSGDIEASANIIKRTLQNFGIDVEMGEVNVGPTVTQYTMKPAEGVKLSKVTGLANDLALALAAHPLRIEAPIPGRSLVGLEIPNKTAAQVRLRDLIDKEEFAKSGDLGFALGRDVSGAPVYADLARMPHLLIAGSTGSGKTIALNSVLLSLLYHNAPQRMRLILIDPKRVEFAVYSGIPHLLAPIVVDNAKAVNALKWSVGEMERRFDALAKAGARDIGSYNSNKKVVETEGPMPYIIIVIDELADLMSSKGREVEALIVRVAQMARAVGIHLILATQRPSVEVITGTIKANITARMAFQVASQVDSRTILDMGGAEKLLGKGDMLYLAPDSSKPKRIQGAYIQDTETRGVAEFLRKQVAAIQGIATEDFGSAPGATHSIDFDNAAGGGADDDDLYEEAKEIVVRSQKASASLLQRRLRVGYARAARLLDILEEHNVIGPGEGAKAREVYVVEEDLRGGGASKRPNNNSEDFFSA